MKDEADNKILTEMVDAINWDIGRIKRMKKQIVIETVTWCWNALWLGALYWVAYFGGPELVRDLQSGWGKWMWTFNLVICSVGHFLVMKKIRKQLDKQIRGVLEARQQVLNLKSDPNTDLR